MVPEGMPEADRADGAVEAATDSSGDGGCTLIALRDAKRCRRGRDGEASCGGGPKAAIMSVKSSLGQVKLPAVGVEVVWAQYSGHHSVKGAHRSKCSSRPR